MIGMERADTQRYSLMRALRSIVNNDWTKAGLELAASKAVSDKLHKLPRSERSFFIPLDIMLRDMPRTQKRDMTAAGVSGSNYLISTDNLPGSFIDLLRNTSVALRMGVQRLSGLVGNVTIPKMTAGNTAYWLADETTQITESQPTLGQLALAPKNVAALTELSHQLMQQSTPDAETLVLTSIARDIGLAVDVGVLRGAGSGGEPTGIATTGSIGAFTGTSLASPGILNAQADVATANALYPGCGYVTTPTVAALLMDRPNVTSATDGTPLWQGGMGEGTMRGYPALSSAQMSAGTALFGWWPSVILAEWGVLELMVNPYSDFTRGLSAVRGWYTCDVGVRYAGAWSYSSSIT
jgi:HK97 family phage major capsid protein